MLHDDVTRRRYLSDLYSAKNPTWDIEDSPWKAGQVLRMMHTHKLSPSKIVEVGCGAGAVLAEIGKAFPQSKLYGFDVAPDAAHFWPKYASSNIKFSVGDFFEHGEGHYDLMLVLDVVEHVANPFEFLTRLHDRADHYIFHFPLDLSAINVARKAPLMYVRNKVGHVYYYTKDLALALLEECDYRVIDWNYTGAAFAAPQRTWKTKLASLPRRLAYIINKDAGVRLLGGETLMVFASARSA